LFFVVVVVVIIIMIASVVWTALEEVIKVPFFGKLTVTVV